jgi:aspartyl aminopeptidase
MKTEIENAIRETLVISNPQSLHLAVDKIEKIIKKDSINIEINTVHQEEIYGFAGKMEADYLFAKMIDNKLPIFQGMSIIINGEDAYDVLYVCSYFNEDETTLCYDIKIGRLDKFRPNYYGRE